MMDSKTDYFPSEPPRDHELLLSDMTRIISTGSEEETLCVLSFIREPIEHRHPAIAEAVLPAIFQIVHTWSPNLKRSLAVTLHHLLNSSIRVPAANMSVSTAMLILLDSPHNSLFDSWAILLSYALPAVDWSALDSFDKFATLFNDFATHQLVSHRLLAAKIVGPLSLSMTSTSIENHLLTSIHSMTNDQSPSVRTAVATSLNQVAENLRFDATDPKLWSNFITLLRDPDAAAQSAAVKSFAHALHAATTKTTLSSTLVKSALSIFMTECSLIRVLIANPHGRTPSDVYMLLRSLADAFGPMLHALDSALSERQRQRAFTAFCGLATFAHPAVRRACAYNFPAVCACMSGTFARAIASIVDLWSRDDDRNTRACLAAGFHLVVQELIRTPGLRIVLPVALRLLDDHPMVRMKMIENLGAMLNPVLRHARPSAAPFMADMCHVLKRNHGSTWREQLLLVNQLEIVHHVIPPPCIREHVVALALDIAKRGSFTVRSGCMSFIAKLLPRISTISEREETMKRIIVQWAQSDTFKRRAAFVDLAHATLMEPIDECLRGIFETEIVTLSRDVVCNIRLKIAKMLCSVKSRQFLKGKYDEMVEALSNDEDREVRGVMDMKASLECEEMSSSGTDPTVIPVRHVKDCKVCDKLTENCAPCTGTELEEEKKGHAEGCRCRVIKVENPLGRSQEASAGVVTNILTDARPLSAS